MCERSIKEEGTRNGILQYAQTQKDFESLAFAYFYSGECHYARNEIDSMIELITRAVAYLSLSKQWELLARAQNLFAITMSSKGNSSIALDYHDLHEPGKLLYASGRSGKNAGIYLKIHKECEPHFQNADYLYVDCLKARYYHLAKNYAQRDACIEVIDERIKKPLPLLDLFDDLEGVCLLLLEIKQYDIFLYIIGRLEMIRAIWKRPDGSMNLFERWKKRTKA